MRSTDAASAEKYSTLAASLPGTRLLADAAFGRSVHVPLDVFVEQETILMESVRRACDSAHVGSVVAVALLDREPRIAGSQALGLRLREVDLLAGRVTQIVAGERGRAHVLREAPPRRVERARVEVLERRG